MKLEELEAELIFDDIDEIYLYVESCHGDIFKYLDREELKSFVDRSYGELRNFLLIKSRKIKLKKIQK